MAGGIFSFIHPSDAFIAIASITGFMFLFVGIMDLIIAFSNRTGLWWLRMISGFLCIGLAFWASGEFGKQAYLLLVWVGLFALFRGINSFFVAFALRSAHKELSALAVRRQDSIGSRWKNRRNKGSSREVGVWARIPGAGGSASPPCSR